MLSVPAIWYFTLGSISCVWWVQARDRSVAWPGSAIHLDQHHACQATTENKDKDRESTDTDHAHATISEVNDDVLEHITITDRCHQQAKDVVY